MRIDLHENQHHVTWITIDPDSPIRVVHAPGVDGEVHEHYLEWERAFDDEDNLRHCPACGCGEMYRRRTFQPLNGFLVVTLVGLLCLALWGLSDVPLVLVIGVVAALAMSNLLIVLFARRYLACYQCGSRFFGVGISRERKEWDAAVAEKYRRRREADPSVTEPAELVSRAADSQSGASA